MDKLKLIMCCVWDGTLAAGYWLGKVNIMLPPRRCSRGLIKRHQCGGGSDTGTRGAYSVLQGKQILGREMGKRHTLFRPVSSWPELFRDNGWTDDSEGCKQSCQIWFRSCCTLYSTRYIQLLQHPFQLLARSLLIEIIYYFRYFVIQNEVVT